MIPSSLLHSALRPLFIPGILVLLAVSLACSAETPTASPAAEPPPAVTATPPALPTRPSQTPAPEPSPTQSPQDQLAAASEQVYALLKELLDELGHRESATPEELQAAEHLQARFYAMGYSTEIQPFAFRHFDFLRWYRTGGENANTVVQGQEFPGLIFATPPNNVTVTGPLTPVGLGRSEDLPPEGLEGKVAWFQPQDGILGDKQALQDLRENVRKIAEAGAVAAVISGNLNFNSYTPLMTAESAIPALLFDTSVGEFWTDTLSGGQVEISVNVEVQEMESRNVVAEMKGIGDGLVIVGGHYDVVPATRAGANDNTSGIAVVLSLAEALAGRSLPFSVRFIAFGSEELGLYGSRHYVASLTKAERARIKVMMNFDVVGSGVQLEVAGHQAFSDLALKIAAELGIEAQPGSMPPGAASDHVPFEDEGIPALLLFGPDPTLPHFTRPEDRLEFVQSRYPDATARRRLSLIARPTGHRLQPYSIPGS